MSLHCLEFTEHRNNQPRIKHNVLIYIMQNLVVFIEPSKDASNISSKAGNLYFNRFCIDEDVACELSGVYYLNSEEPLNFTLRQKPKGNAN